MAARKNGCNQSAPLTRPRNERPAIWACSHRGKPGDWRASPQTRSMFVEPLPVSRNEMERIVVNEFQIVVAVAYAKPSLSLLAGNSSKEDASDLGDEFLGRQLLLGKQLLAATESERTHKGEQHQFC